MLSLLVRSACRRTLAVGAWPDQVNTLDMDLPTAHGRPERTRRFVFRILMLAPHWQGLCSCGLAASTGIASSILRGWRCSNQSLDNVSYRQHAQLAAALMGHGFYCLVMPHCTSHSIMAATHRATICQCVGVLYSCWCMIVLFGGVYGSCGRNSEFGAIYLAKFGVGLLQFDSFICTYMLVLSCCHADDTVQLGPQRDADRVCQFLFRFIFLMPCRPTQRYA